MTKLSRRQILQLLPYGAGLFIGGCAKRYLPMPAKPSARVVVVGGGFGGATAAKYLRLLDPTLAVTLVERNRTFIACPGSNEVIAGWHDLEWLACDYRVLADRYGIELIHAEATVVDPVRREVTINPQRHVAYDRLIMAPGIAFRWDALQGYGKAESEIAPHAWQAGPQTLLLRRQLEAMPSNGTVLITVPANPYRCPPGPYERASLIAHYCRRHKPKARIVLLDAKTQFSKQALFEQGWARLYPGMIDWRSSQNEGQIDHIDVAQCRVYTEFGEHRADVLNVIPPQKASALAERAGLTDATGWCPVKPTTFESTLHGAVHVVGDACIATPMPKSAFSANSQAKACALAVIASLRGEPVSPPSLINTCYSVLAEDYAVSISGVYEANGTTLTATGGGETPLTADKSIEARFARSWRKNFYADVFR